MFLLKNTNIPESGYGNWTVAVSTGPWGSPIKIVFFSGIAEGDESMNTIRNVSSWPLSFILNAQELL